MRLKLFRAAEMAQAMADIRVELGPDALILSSRRIPGGIEVTAATEAEADIPAPVPVPLECQTWPASNHSLGNQVAGQHPGREAALAYHGVPALLASRLMAGPLPLALATALRFKAIPTAQGSPPILVVGTPGAGKTLTVARLATRLVMAGVKPLVISADGQRAGAVEQLGAFTNLLGVGLLVASQPAALGRALARRAEGAPVLIDAPGCDALDPGRCAEVAALACAAGAAILVVMPGGMDPGEAAEIAAAFASIGAGMMVANRLDISRRLGGVLAAAHVGLALVEAGIGPGAADGLVPITAAMLAERLQRMENRQ